MVGATLLSFWVATRNFAVADPLKSPRTGEVLQMARIEGDQSQVMFSRYFASESNRAMFGLLGPLQVVGCAGAFLLAFGVARGRPGGRVVRGLLATCFGAALAMAPLVPLMIEKGRAIDFVPRSTPSAERDAFYLWHSLYMVGDAVLLIAAIAAVPLLVKLLVQLLANPSGKMIATAPAEAGPLAHGDRK